MSLSHSAAPPASVCSPVFALCAAGVRADVHAREQQIRAHAQFIVLTENAVGFENGGQCVSSNRETYPLYVSKAAANKQQHHAREKTPLARAPMRARISRIPQLLCVRSKHGAFPGFVTT